jgi:hypothetical protein
MNWERILLSESSLLIGSRNRQIIMKTIFLIGALLGVFNLSEAIPINAPSDMIGTGSLVGTYAYLWDVGSLVIPKGDQITSASISFTSVTETAGGSGNDISVDFGRIFSGMSFSGTGTGVKSGQLTGYLPGAGKDSTTNYVDNDALGDAFSQNNTIKSNGYYNAYSLGKQSFPSLNVTTNFTFNFTTNELAALDNYVTGLWGFEIDPDCHFNVGAICFNYTIGPTNNVRPAPDAPATAGLISLSLLGMLIVHAKFAKNFSRKNFNASLLKNRRM